MYEKFYEELFESGKLYIYGNTSSSIYVVKVREDSGLPGKNKFHVEYSSNDEITCDCGLYNHLGMLCRHSIKVNFNAKLTENHAELYRIIIPKTKCSYLTDLQVLVHLDICKIPPKNIMKRWTKEASVCEQVTCGLKVGMDESKLMKKALLVETLRVVNNPCALDASIYQSAMDLLAKALSPDTSIPEDQTADKVVETDSVPKIPLACPERTMGVFVSAYNQILDENNP